MQYFYVFNIFNATIAAVIFLEGRMPKTTINSKSSFIYTCITTALYYIVCGFSDTVVIAFFLQAFWGYFNPVDCLPKQEADDASNVPICNLSPSSQNLLIVCCGTAALMLCKALLEFYCNQHNEQLKTTHAALKELKTSLENVRGVLQDTGFQLALNNMENREHIRQLQQCQELLSKMDFSSKGLQIVPFHPVGRTKQNHSAYWFLDQFTRYQIWLTAFNCAAVLPLMWHDLFITIRQEQRSDYAIYSLVVSAITAILLRIKDISQSSSQTQERIKLEGKIDLLIECVARWQNTLNNLYENFKTFEIDAANEGIDANVQSMGTKLTQIGFDYAELCRQRGFFNNSGLNPNVINHSAINSAPDDEQPLLLTPEAL